ncbi:hypothetical protein TcWFU_003867 [Taenia crassiceps]|uniref:Transmembrane protein n=1 Tax=Taenia crassiceps TaxID=6207 RepID=A0ABR4Q700_9CEST
MESFISCHKAAHLAGSAIQMSRREGKVEVSPFIYANNGECSRNNATFHRCVVCFLSTLIDFVRTLFSLPVDFLHVSFFFKCLSQNCCPHQVTSTSCCHVLPFSVVIIFIVAFFSFLFFFFFVNM